MAFIKSVLFSGARNKIGNVILQTYNKKTIARSLNTSISVAPSAAQIAQRTKFQNNIGAHLIDFGGAVWNMKKLDWDNEVDPADCV